MTKLFQRVVSVLGIACVVAYLFFVVLYKPKLFIPPVKAANLPDFLFEDVTISRINNGKLVWELESAKASVSKADQKVVLDGVKGDFLTLKDAPISFNSKSADYFMDDPKLSMKYAVATIKYEDDPITLHAETLVWSEKSNELIGQGGIKIVSPKIDLYGETFVVNIPAQRIKINHKAHADIRFKETL